MPRRFPLASIATVLALLPGAASGQDTRALTDTLSAQTPLETEEGQLFLKVFETISQYHSTALGDSALWERAIDGLLEQLDDPYARVFTPVEYGRFTETNTGKLRRNRRSDQPAGGTRDRYRGLP